MSENTLPSSRAGSFEPTQDSRSSGSTYSGIVACARGKRIRSRPQTPEGLSQGFTTENATDALSMVFVGMCAVLAYDRGRYGGARASHSRVVVFQVVSVWPPLVRQGSLVRASAVGRKAGNHSCVTGEGADHRLVDLLEVECLACGCQRLAAGSDHFGGSECPSCGYVGWAEPASLTDRERDLLHQELAALLARVAGDRRGERGR